MVTTYPVNVFVMSVSYIIPDTLLVHFYNSYLFPDAPLSQIYYKLYAFKKAIRSMEQNVANFFPVKSVLVFFCLIQAVGCILISQ